MEQSRTVKTIFLSTGQIIAGLAMIIVFAVMSRVLSVHDYGTYMQTMLVYSTVLPFLTLGLPQAPFYFLPRQKDRARASIYENLLLLVFMGSIFSIFILLGGNKLFAALFGNPDLKDTLLIIAPYPIFMLPVLSLPACLLALGRVVPIPIFSVAAKLTMLVFVIGACLIWQSYTGALIALVVSSVLVLGPGLRLMIGSCPSGINTPTLSGAREQLKYSLPLGIAGFIGVLSLKFNQIVVSSICTPEEFAIYVNGAIEIPIVAFVMESVRSVLLSDFVKMHEKGDTKTIRDLWLRSIVNASALFVPIMIFCFVLAPELIRTLFSAKYEAAVIPFRILSVLLIIRSISLNSVFLATGQTKLVLLRGGVSLILNMIISIALVKFFGYIGAAIGLVIVMYFWALPFTLSKTAGLLNCKFREIYPFQTVAKIIAASLLAAISLAIKGWFGTFHDVVVLGLCAVLYFPLVFWLIWSLKVLDLPKLSNLLRGLVINKSETS